MAKQQKSVNVGFADAYVGCSTLANIMGLHEETVRKRAKRGKIPGQLVNGKWTFKHAELAARMIQPFASATPAITLAAALTPPAVPAMPQIARVNETDVIFVLDRSGSMSHLMGQARKNLDEQVETLRAAAGPSDRYLLSLIAFDDYIDQTITRQDVTLKGARASSSYPSARGGTKLNDAILEAIALARRIDDGRQAFLISIVTDGGENASSTGSRDRLAQAIRETVGTGRYTFAYAGPHGSDHYATGIGIATGNVTSWETTVLGTQHLGATMRSSLQSYSTSRSVGVMSSTSFYAQPVVSNAQDFANRLGQQLSKLDPKDFRVERVMETDPIVIQKFCEAKLGGFQKGKIYYQLTASEKVQDYKKIVIQDTATGAFYAGWDAAAKLLGIPKFSGTVRIRPGKLGEFKVFVQSTSVNRKLRPGTAVVFLP